MPAGPRARPELYGCGAKIKSVPSSSLLTTPEFFASVHQLSPRVAVFDCDGTLWSGDAGSAFMRWSFDTGLLSAERRAWLEARYAAYNAGTVNELQICGEMVQVYAGLPVATLQRAAADFFCTHVQPNVFPELLELITTLQAPGTEIWAVSSTNDWVIEEGVKLFNIPAERVLAARVHAAAGIVTDSLIDVPTDQGKVDALARAGIIAPDAVFGNSVHDAAMLAIARRAFPVNPTPALLTRSQAEGWPVYFPASVLPTSMA